MSIQSDLLRGLEEASQKQETEIVIEFRGDRILHYVGVYLIFVLAAISKVSQLAGNNLSCYPANVTSGADRTFVLYATDYCWESSTLDVKMPATGNITENPACGIREEEALLLIQNPALVKRFVQWMPYIMMLEALLLALPSAWWHLRVGSRLVGHLKFMKLLLNEIYESLKLIKVADYQNTPYDEDSYYLNDWRRYEPGYAATGRAGEESLPRGCLQACCTNTRKVSYEGEGNSRIKDDKQADVEMTALKSNAPVQEQTTDKKSLLKEGGVETVKRGNVSDEGTRRITAKSSTRPQSLLSQIFVGKLLDRHLFSMICYENFSSLEHHPYILSIFQLTRTPTGNVRADNIPMKQAILRQLCHERNFTGRFLIHTYVWRHALGTLISLGLFIVMAWVIHLLGPDNWGSESFRCDVIHHANVCLICTMHRKRDMFAMLVVNLAVLAGYFVCSMYQWCFIRASGRRSMAFYFEDISDATSLALEVAYDEEQAKKND